MSGLAVSSVQGGAAVERDPLHLAWLLSLALLARLAFWNGQFGSDDLTYLERAAEIARGEWTTADYNGALRYAFNIPAGLAMAVFGDSVHAANLWPLVCSLVEVAAVWLFARHAFGWRAAWIAGLLLASAPLHVAVATRIHADSVVSMFLTSTFVLLWFGLQRRRLGLLFGAGLAIGGVFWSKELAAVTWIGMLPLLLLFRGRWRDLVPVLAGVAATLLAHGALMTAIAGDPLHLVRTVLRQLQKGFVGGGTGQDAAGYYLRYLFFDVRHTALIGPLAAAGLATALWRWRVAGAEAAGFVFAALWLIGLLLVLSVLPVSLSPLRFTMKQSNYITLFLAPLAILAGVALARAPIRWAVATTAVAVVGALLLAALQQADYRGFTANSKALARWVQTQGPEVRLVGSTNNAALGSHWRDPEFSGARRPILAWRDVVPTEATVDASQPARTVSVGWYVAIDPQTVHWFAGPRPLREPLPCWTRVAEVRPIDLAWSNRAAAAVADGLASFGGDTGPIARLSEALDRLGRPRSAVVYRVEAAELTRCRAP
ncbi:MAG: hypothetical protein RLZZ451_254 [Pseudomonadota bacterium]